MIVTWDTLRADLKDPLKARETMQAFLGASRGLPHSMQIVANMFIATMGDLQVIALADLLVNCSVYLEKSDLEGLKQYLTSVNVPPAILNMVLSYARTNQDKLES